MGGGAAGFFCAINAARINPALQVTIIEKSSRLLSKVKVSGGGRCNVTQACFDIEQMSRQYPRGRHFVRKAFHRFFTTDTINWFEERGVKLKTEKDGRMFPISDSSQTIIECLTKEAERYGVKILMNTEAKKIRRHGSNWELETNAGPLVSDFLCIAAGGYPKSTMFDWIRETGHSIEAPVPSLFTFNMPGNPIRELMGIAVDKTRVKVVGSALVETGPLLITHWGMSGPVILRLSAWGARELANRGYEFRILVNWLPDLSEQQIRQKFAEQRAMASSSKIAGRNPFGLPSRLWDFLLLRSGCGPTTRWAELPAKEQNKIIHHLSAFECAVKGKTAFKEEFVTAGGVRLQEVDVNSMMSKKSPDLFFAGEMLDVDGITGGYNFQHAWTSGFIAAQSIAERASAY